MFHRFVAKKLIVFSHILLDQVLDMPAVLEAVTILERLPITKEALEVKFRVLYSKGHFDSFNRFTALEQYFLWL